MDDRFKGDELPDATWNICKIHGVVRLVNERGVPAIGGICSVCHAEAHSPDFFSCPVHGINPRRKEKDGCPVEGCLGVGSGPSAEEVEQLARQDAAAHIRSITRPELLHEQVGGAAPSGADVGAGVVAAAAAGPADERGGAAGEGGGDAPQLILFSDPPVAPPVILAPSGAPARGIIDRERYDRMRAQLKSLGVRLVPKPAPAPEWRDPFLVEGT